MRKKAFNSFFNVEEDYICAFNLDQSEGNHSKILSSRSCKYATIFTDLDPFCYIKYSLSNS